jgi:hypothetical protein
LRVRVGLGSGWGPHRSHTTVLSTNCTLNNCSGQLQLHTGLLVCCAFSKADNSCVSKVLTPAPCTLGASSCHQQVGVQLHGLWCSSGLAERTIEHLKL